MLKIKSIHKKLANAANEKRDAVLAALGLQSLTQFYKILDGKRPCSMAEKEAIAKIYEVPVDELFKEEPKKQTKKKSKL